MKLKKFILGAANFGNNYGLKPKNLSEKKIQEILSTSSKLGLKIIDTAQSYGKSENFIGKKLPKFKLKVITKITIDNKRKFEPIKLPH